MIEIKSLHDLNQYANFETFSYEGKTIILYDDHRCILTALFEARRLGIINDKTDVISFDMHDDARPIHLGWDEIKKFRDMGIENVSRRDFKNFVEFDIREYDDDWVTVGMELGLINNIVNIGNEECWNIDDWKNHKYIDKRGKIHHGLTIPLINQSEDSTKDILVNDSLYTDFKIVRDIFGYNIPEDGTYLSGKKSNFVLDFDLDCFTLVNEDEQYAWPENYFKQLFGTYGSDNREFIQQLIKGSKFITICREPSYCGGIGESNKILGYLDKYFFRGCLGTQSILP